MTDLLTRTMLELAHQRQQAFLDERDALLRVTRAESPPTPPDGHIDPRPAWLTVWGWLTSRTLGR